MEKLNRAAEEEMLLEVRDLHTYFHMPGGGTVIKAVEGVNFTLKKGKVLGIIGESGSGKKCYLPRDHADRGQAGKDRERRGDLQRRGSAEEERKRDGGAAGIPDFSDLSGSEYFI